MATFHDLKHIVKDTIAVDAKQRYTPQEVKFINRNNEFYGIFHGKVDATKLLVSNAELSGCTIFDENGISVDVSNLGKSQEEIKELIKDLNGELYELSTKTKDWISEAVSKLSGSVIENVALSIETISTNLSNEIEGLGTTVTEISNYLDDRVSKNENDIKDIKEKQVGAISYRGTIRLFDADTSFHDIFFRNFDDRAFTAEQIDSTVLEQGWMWCVQADDHKKHYLIEGEFIEHGDFIVINRKVQIKEINRDCVDILDMMDFDLSCDTKLDFESVNPVQNKVITNELESLKQIMTGIDTRVEYVEGVLESIPDANDYTKNQVVTVKSSNNIHTEYILCENDDGEKYWKQYVVDGIFERKEFKNQYSDSSANAVEQLSDSNDHYPSSRLVKKIYEDLDKSDKKLIKALEKEVSDREAQDGIISTCLSNKIDQTKIELEKANSIISSELTSLINEERVDRIASLTTMCDEMHSLYGQSLTAINNVYSELTSNYSELTSAIESEKNYRISADNAILTTLNDYMEKETQDRIATDTQISNILTDKIDAEISNRLTSYNDLLVKLNTESSTREMKDDELSSKLMHEIIDRIAKDNNLSTLIENEANIRSKEDNRILTSLYSMLTCEIDAVNNQSKRLSSELTSLINDVDSDLQEYKISCDNAIEKERSERQNADKFLCCALTSYVEHNDLCVNNILTGFNDYKKYNDGRVDAVSSYAESLCSTTEYKIDDIKQTLVGSVRYMGHITLPTDTSAFTIGEIVRGYVANNDKLSNMTVLSNGWMFTVTFADGMPSSVIELSTKDGVVLTPKDYIIIDNHTPDSCVALSDISRETIDIIDVVDDIFVKRSEHEKTKTDLSNYIATKVNEVSTSAQNDNDTLSNELKHYIDTQISDLSVTKIELTSSTVLSSISQINGKLCVETRKLSIDELENANNFVKDKISEDIKELSCKNLLSGDNNQMISFLSQDNGKISYKIKQLEISCVDKLSQQLNWLSSATSANLTTINTVSVALSSLSNDLVLPMFMTAGNLYSEISANLYLSSDGVPRKKEISEIDFDDTIKVCYELMNRLDAMFNPKTGTINIIRSYEEALPMMDRKFY